MKLSIIIPCYNEKKTIVKLLDSVKASSIEDLEIIVIDDYSTDGTRDMTKRTLPINQTAVFNGSMTLGNYADKQPFFIQYKTGTPEEYKMVLNGTICFNSFPDIYKNDFKIIEDKLKNPGAISNNYGELLSSALSSKGSTEEKNEAEKSEQKKNIIYNFI